MLFKKLLLLVLLLTCLKYTADSHIRTRGTQTGQDSWMVGSMPGLESWVGWGVVRTIPDVATDRLQHIVMTNHTHCMSRCCSCSSFSWIHKGSTDYIEQNHMALALQKNVCNQNLSDEWMRVTSRTKNSASNNKTWNIMKLQKFLCDSFPFISFVIQSHAYPRLPM